MQLGNMGEYTPALSTSSETHRARTDCLALNGWTRPSNMTKQVIVFIHGGRFSAGTSNTPFYQADILASAQDVVVVTFNFRMNIFGLPGSPETRQNLGFLDQYSAVSWLNTNIASFGSDPSRITIVGQSSDAFAVSHWAYAFKDKPLVAGTLGCGTSGKMIECIRSPNISMDAILAAMKKVPTPPGSHITRSQPTFQAINDNTTVFTAPEYLNRLQGGHLAYIPYLSLMNDHESGFYRISALAQGNSLPESNWTNFELDCFTCTTSVENYWRSQAGIHSFRERHVADWENLRLYDSPSSGACHGVEFNSITRNSEGVSGIAPSGDQVEHTVIMQKAWAEFAADPADELVGLGWPQYGSGMEDLVLLGEDAVDFVSAAPYDTHCSGLGLEYWDSGVLMFV